MRRRRKDIAIASRCAEASFILKGEDETEYIARVPKTARCPVTGCTEVAHRAGRLR